jgi:hypothetical protein
LVPAFDQGVETVRGLVAQSQVKRIGQQAMTGQMLLVMMDALTDALNQQVVPQLTTVWDALSRSHWLQTRQRHWALVKQMCATFSDLPPGPTLFTSPAVRNLAHTSWRALCDNAMEPPTWDDYHEWSQDIATELEQQDKYHQQRYFDVLTSVASELTGNLGAHLTTLIKERQLPMELEMFGQVLLTKGGIVTQQQQSDLEHLQQKVKTITAELEAVQSKYQTQTTDHKIVQTELADARNQLLIAADKTQGAQDECRQLQEDITGVQKALNDAVAHGMDLRASQESNEFELRVTQEENTELKAEVLATQKEMVTNHYQIAELQRQVADFKQQQQDDQVSSVALVQCREQLEQSKTALEQAKQQQRELETRLRIAKSHEDRLNDNARKRPRINGPDEALTATNQWLRDRQRSDQTQIMDLKTENRQLIAELRRSNRDHFNSGITRFAQSTGLK